MRLVATTAGGSGSTKYLQLGHTLQPLPAYGRVLAALSDANGIFVGRFPNGIAAGAKRKPAKK